VPAPQGFERNTRFSDRARLIGRILHVCLDWRLLGTSLGNRTRAQPKWVEVC
jgi:hypothetical protein